MKAIPGNLTEALRIEALKSYEVLDSDCEQDFDDIASLLTNICEMPIALIGFMDADRLWLKARIGVTATEAVRTRSFCDHTIRQANVMIVPDALNDSRFRESPLVTGNPGIRFYAGAALIDQHGYAIGTLCVQDYRPRSLSRNQIDALDKLRRQVMNLLDLRRSRTECRNIHNHARPENSMIPVCGHCHAVRNKTDAWQKIEQYFQEAVGIQFTHGVCPECMVEHYSGSLKSFIGCKSAQPQ
jgi:hypothetical protein